MYKYDQERKKNIEQQNAKNNLSFGLLLIGFLVKNPIEDLN